MKKIVLGSVLLASLASSVSAAPRSYGSIEFGFETINYKENFVLLGQELSQDSLIINPIQHSLSYTAIESNEKLGFYLESTSTLFESIVDEDWSLGQYGEIQNNDLVMSSIDVKVQGAYNVAPHSQLLAGISFFVLDFTRSSFTRSSGGDFFHADIVNGNYDADLIANVTNPADQDAIINAENCDSDGPGDHDQDGEKGFCMSSGSVSESQNSVEFLFGYIYDSNFAERRDFSWYAQAELALPIWHRTTNSGFEGQALDEFGGGWGVNTRAGVRWSITKKVNFTLGAVATYKTRDKVSENVGARVLSVPKIDYTNVQMLAGLVWYL